MDGEEDTNRQAGRVYYLRETAQSLIRRGINRRADGWMEAGNHGR